MKKVSGIIFIALFRILSIVVLILGIRLIGEGVYNYIDEHNQQDWISVSAKVEYKEEAVEILDTLGYWKD